MVVCGKWHIMHLLLASFINQILLQRQLLLLGETASLASVFVFRENMYFLLDCNAIWILWAIF